MERGGEGVEKSGMIIMMTLWYLVSVNKHICKMASVL